MKIRFFYDREVDGKVNSKGIPVITNALLTLDNGVTLQGQAVCRLEYDNPKKEVGRKLALQRAIKQATPTLSKEQRKEIWLRYLTRDLGKATRH